ncbi:branched-chain amino acid ABC transporter permease [Chelatococcus reniformis]|uniref:Branched-chain amino acid ABC transporter permease n=1 Tax=Chelatococcus reniformis TaxID=1494448 RepID=A0A916TZJ8_9HYPH|nr:branched-chain amino acid ABC transporter permease [Chelatococcus reniformis]GGC47828.1 branched-chain amino acid ABC transporter permease [Chelatococcus reniformis]
MTDMPDLATASVPPAKAPTAWRGWLGSLAGRRTLLAVLGIAALAVLLAVPATASSRYIVYLGTLLALHGVLAVSLNIIMGFAGQFALAHAAFYGLGAYTSAILIRDFDLSFWASLPPTAAAAALLAAAIGYPSLRFTGGIHFALITFAFGELIRLVTANWHDLTGGPQGMQLGFSPEPLLGIDFGSTRGIYALAAGLLVISLAIAAAIRFSRFGRSLVAIREDEVLASSLGINVTANKMAAFVITSVLAALAGTIYGPFVGFISPEMMSASDSISVVGMLIVGGLGTLAGPIFGTLIFMGLPELLRVAKLYRLVILGLIIIAVVLFAPKGVAGVIDRLIRPKRGGAR